MYFPLVTSVPAQIRCKVINAALVAFTGVVISGFGIGAKADCHSDLKHYFAHHYALPDWRLTNYHEYTGTDGVARCCRSCDKVGGAKGWAHGSCDGIVGDLDSYDFVDGQECPPK